jgi:protein TonB
VDTTRAATSSFERLDRTRGDEFMPRARDVLMTIALLAAPVGVGSCDSESSGPTGPPRFVEPQSATIRLGESLQFNEGTSQRVQSWSVLDGAEHGIISEQGLYRAPFIRPASSNATVVADFGGFTSSSVVEFGPAPPDPQECCGPAQTHLPEPGEFVYIDELPEALVRAAPAYPDSAREAGISGTVLVQALVCSSGQIFDVRVQQSVPGLDGASIAAVQQWVFAPARVGGQPVAVWVVIPVKFSLHEPPSLPGFVLAVPRGPSTGQSSDH